MQIFSNCNFGNTQCTPRCIYIPLCQLNILLLIIWMEEVTAATAAACVQGFLLQKHIYPQPCFVCESIQFNSNSNNSEKYLSNLHLCECFMLLVLALFLLLLLFLFSSFPFLRLFLCCFIFFLHFFFSYVLVFSYFFLLVA